MKERYPNITIEVIDKGDRYKIMIDCIKAMKDNNLGMEELEKFSEDIAKDRNKELIEKIRDWFKVIYEEPTDSK